MWWRILWKFKNKRSVIRYLHIPKNNNIGTKPSEKDGTTFEQISAKSHAKIYNRIEPKFDKNHLFKANQSHRDFGIHPAKLLPQNKMQRYNAAYAKVQINRKQPHEFFSKTLIILTEYAN